MTNPTEPTENDIAKKVIVQARQDALGNDKYYKLTALRYLRSEVYQSHLKQAGWAIDDTTGK